MACAPLLIFVGLFVLIGLGLWFVLADDREQDFTDEEDEF